MKNTYAISGPKLNVLFEILDEYGIQKIPFLESLQIDPSLFTNHGKKLTVSQLSRLLEHAVLLTDNKDLGLLCGEKSKYMPNIVCYIMMNCLTVGKALEKYSQYKRIFSDETNIRLSEDNGGYCIEMSSSVPEFSTFRTFNDYKLASMFVFLRFLTSGNIKLQQVSVKHVKPENPAEYLRLFGCPVKFSQSHNALLISKETLNTPITCPNNDLLQHFEQYAQQLLDKISSSESFTKKISQLLIRMMRGGNTPSIESVARINNMSVRKLQNLFEKENTTFKNILQIVRKEMALAYLGDQQILFAEVAYLLGFSDTSSFHRAFKQWTGRTPGQFRSFSKISD